MCTFIVEELHYMKLMEHNENNYKSVVSFWHSYCLSNTTVLFFLLLMLLCLRWQTLLQY